MNKEIHSKRGARAAKVSEIKRQSLLIVNIDKSSPIYKPNENRILELYKEQLEIEKDLLKLEKNIYDPNRVKLNKDEFLNVIKSAADKMKAGSPEEKDRLCRILFLNVLVDNEKVAHYLWKEPFASLVKATELSYGRGERT